MSSSYSTDLRIELITTGEQAGVWGITTNNNLQNVIEQAIAGYISVSITSASQALTYINGGSSTPANNQSGYAMVALSTTTTAAFSVFLPPNSRMYLFYNASAYQATIYNSTTPGDTTAAGTGTIIPAGDSLMVWSDGTNVKPVISNNWDLGIGFPTNAQKYIQVTNTSAGSSAYATVSAKSDVQTAGIYAYSSTVGSSSGITRAGKAFLYAAGTASTGLTIWDNSTTPTIQFVIGAGTTAGSINSSGNWSFNSKTLSSATWNGSNISPSYGGTGVSNNAANTLTFSGNYGLTLTLTNTTSVTLPTSGTLATTAGTVNSLAGNNATFAPFSDNTNFLYGYTIQHTSASGPTAGPTLKFVNAAGTGIATITGNSTGFGFGNSSGAYTLPVYAYSFVSAASTGTAPFTVSSTSIVNNLNVQYLNGKQSTDFLLSSTAVTPAQGGTGVANGSNNTITFTGNYTLGLTLTGSTSVTLPTSGTLTTTAGYTSYLQNTSTFGGTHTLAGFSNDSYLTYGFGLRATGTTAPVLAFLNGADGATLGQIKGVSGGVQILGTTNTVGTLSFSTVTSGTWNGSVIGAAYGGTGVANNAANTITFSGNYPLALTLSGSTSVTLPTSGTLVANNSSPTFTNVTADNVVYVGGASGTPITNTAGTAPGYHLRAFAYWAAYNGINVPINIWYNFSSVTYVATGRYNFNFTTGMPDQYSAVTVSSMFYANLSMVARTISTTGIRINMQDATAAYVDADGALHVAR